MASAIKEGKEVTLVVGERGEKKTMHALEAFLSDLSRNFLVV